MSRSDTVSNKPVDPWEMQRQLMVASNQKLPSGYVLHPGVILYAALNMEELSETVEGLRSAVAKHASEHPNMPQIEALLEQSFMLLRANSKAIRALVKELPKHLELPLERGDLRAMSDGTTDLAVTNSGFALSLGLPGARLYDEVASSNLSKKNPDTGVIDTLPDGKWIKGRNYREPDIDGVLYPQSQQKVA